MARGMIMIMMIIFKIEKKTFVERFETKLREKRRKKFKENEFMFQQLKV